MLKLRVATAVVLLLILWFAIWAGPLAFAGVMAICFGLVLYEWLRIGNLGPVPAALIAAIEMISQFSLYWAQALPKMDWFLFIVNGGVMVAWGVIFFAELFHRYNGFKVNGGDLCAVGLFVASLALRSRQLGIGFVSLPYRVGCRHLRLFLWPRLGQA